MSPFALQRWERRMTSSPGNANGHTVASCDIWFEACVTEAHNVPVCFVTTSIYGHGFPLFRFFVWKWLKGLEKIFLELL